MKIQLQQWLKCRWKYWQKIISWSTIFWRVLEENQKRKMSHFHSCPVVNIKEFINFSFQKLKYNLPAFLMISINLSFSNLVFSSSVFNRWISDPVKWKKIILVVWVMSFIGWIFKLSFSLQLVEIYSRASYCFSL